MPSEGRHSNPCRRQGPAGLRIIGVKESAILATVFPSGISSPVVMEPDCQFPVDSPHLRQGVHPAIVAVANRVGTPVEPHAATYVTNLDDRTLVTILNKQFKTVYPFLILLMKIQSILFALVFTCFCVTAHAKVKMSTVFGNHMVLQRDVEIPVWGTADANETVTVTLGADKATATADVDGKWMLKLPKCPASETPVELVVSGKNTIILNDVLIGDVWLASGQSNMEMAFFWNAPGKEAAKTINDPLIRMIKVPDMVKDTPQPMLTKGSWSACVQSGSISYISQLPYYFAHELQQKLNIPIGIINSSCSGTAIESWMSAETLAADPAGLEIQEHWKQVLTDFPAKQKKYEDDKAAWEAAKAAALAAGTPFAAKAPGPPSGAGSTQSPSGLYHAMIYPLAPFALRGIVWYQGENNTRHSERYRTFLPALIKNWRALFAQGDLPFFWVQLPNYNMGTEYGDNWAGVREAQTMALSVPNTGQVVTIDIGVGNEIHPNNKAQIGHRLALVVLVHAYGDKTVIDSGPIFDHADLTSNPVRIYFTHIEGGLKQAAPPEGNAAWTGINGFALAGEDKVFHPAEAKIDAATNTVLLGSSAVPKPVAVRYAWSNDPEKLSLVNSADLPLAPFRTDDWPEPQPAPPKPKAAQEATTPAPTPVPEPAQ